MAKSKAAVKPTPGVGLLVSVRSVEEAKVALDGGADLIDVKDPSKGSLGMADAEIVGGVLKLVNGKVPVSAALGEWSSNILTEAVWHLELPLNYIKWGLAGYPHQPGWGEDLLDTRRQISAQTEVVCVAYADAVRAKSITPGEIVKFAKRYRFKVFLFDTFMKDGKSLLKFVSREELAEWVGVLKSANIKVALGGSLTLEMVDDLRELAPDWFAVRGAVCVAGKRDAEIDPSRLKKWKAALEA